jgi:shikimate kinase
MPELKMSKPNLIFLTGFSTSGKSTIGPLLANTLGFEFLDLDKNIVELEGQSINEIFKTKGETYFRDLEYNLLCKLTMNEDMVIALGGGTVQQERCLETILQSGTLVYLRSDLDTLVRRLSHKTDRPLIKGPNGEKLSKEQIKEKILAMLQEREPKYLKAQITINTDKTPLGQTVEHLTRMVEKYMRQKTRQNQSQKPKPYRN